MERKSEILDKIGRQSGMTVPEGFFADFAARMATSLPEKAVEEAPQQRSLWLKIRPFAYMAAMFAGIWLMMQMFGLMRSNKVDLSIDNYPGLREAMATPSYVDDYVYPSIDEYELYDALYNQGINPEDISFEYIEQVGPVDMTADESADVAQETTPTEVVAEPTL